MRVTTTWIVPFPFGSRAFRKRRSPRYQEQAGISPKHATVSRVLGEPLNSRGSRSRIGARGCPLRNLEKFLQRFAGYHPAAADFLRRQARHFRADECPALGGAEDPRAISVAPQIKSRGSRFFFPMSHPMSHGGAALSLKSPGIGSLPLQHGCDMSDRYGRPCLHVTS